MARVFTDEEFKGYEFRCTCDSANMGFKHICKVYNPNGEEVEGATSSINYLNRTWESYPFQSVYEQSKSLLRDKLNGVEEDKDYDLDFLNRLAEEYYITDYGYMDNGELVIMFDGWSQVEGDKHYDSEKQEWVLNGKSVYAKLQELAEKNLLKPSINKTIKEVEFVFTDEYCKCDECGKIFNTTYGELTLVDYRMLCDECLADDSEAIQELIETAQSDFRSALKPNISEDMLEEMGYAKLNEESFSCSRYMWGESRFGYGYINMDFAEELCKAFNGFVKLDSVQQFDSPFFLYVPNEYKEVALKSMEEGKIVEI